MQTILLLKSAFLCVFRFFGLSSFDTVTTLILSHLASFLPFFEVIPEILFKFAQDQRFCGLEILSISSCQKTKGEKHHKLNRAFVSWKDTLFDAYSIGQSKSAMFLMSNLKGYLSFPFDFHRIENMPLSPEQDKIIDMDNASEDSLRLLIKIADNTAMNEKMRPEIAHFFQTKKTLNPKEY